MTAFVAKRIASSLLLLLGLVTVVFVIMRLLPGDPAALFITPTVPRQVADRIREQFGLDQPVLVQYLQWLWNALQGRLGFSLVHQKEVGQVIAAAFPHTAALAITAVLLEIAGGVSIGTLCARFRGRFLDRLISSSALVLYTLPTFWVGVLLLAAFSYGLGLLPPSQTHSIGAETLGIFGYVLDYVVHLILPAVALAIAGAAGVARYLRTGLVSALDQEYVTAARSMGVSERKILTSYALPNAAIPLITVVGLDIGTLLAGALVVETLFSWPGMGRLTVLAIFSRDYPLVAGCALLSGTMVVAANFVADLLYAIFDPRIRIAS